MDMVAYETPTIHTPVLVDEVIAALNLRPDGVYVDATLGTGGHFQAIATRLSQKAFLIGLDADPMAIDYVRNNVRIDIQHQLYNQNFAELERVCYRLGRLELDGILFDLGLSSFALEDVRRGFAYLKDGPLDMRFNPQEGYPASQLVNNASVEELAHIFWRYGEERLALRIARAIGNARSAQPLKSTLQLAQIVRSVVPADTAIKTLSRIFQALRIEVNRELERLPIALEQAIKLLRPGGRLVVISYHSLEDRIVKQFFNREARDCICPPEFPICNCGHKSTLRILTHKPIKAKSDEISVNPRARSARLRVAERI